MKKKVFVNLLLLLSILLGTLHVEAQVDKALKYAYYFDYARAEKYLMNTQDSLDDAMVVQLADALYLQGKYAQALFYYKRADARKAIKEKQTQRNYVHASSLMQEKSPYFRKTDYFKGNYFLYTAIDTFKGNSANEDFTTCWWNNTLFVTTSRSTIANSKEFNYNFTRMPFLDVLPFNAKGERVPYPSFFPGSINTALHDGPIAISADTSMIVLTRNYPKGDGKDNYNLYLVYFQRLATGKWTQAQVANFSNPSFSVQHPYFNSGDGFLYFASNKPGGFGGFDLYKSRWNGKEWTVPVNLGPDVNSEYDEVFPAFTPTGDLIYSTNHIETTGGLDIVLFTNGKRYLLNEPLNTAFDDFAFFFKSKDEGYFSSNRFTNRFNDEIYHFKLSEPPKQTLFVKVKDGSGTGELTGARVLAYTEDGRVVADITTTTSNSVLVKDTFDARKPLHITVEKPGYKFFDLTDNDFQIRDGKLVKEVALVKRPVYAADNSYVIQDNRTAFKPGSLYDNDQQNGGPVNSKDILLHVMGNPLPDFIKIDQADGQLKVLADAPAGTYAFNYAMCLKNSPSECDTAKVELVIKKSLKDLLTGEYYADGEAIVPGVAAVNDTAYVNVNGGFAVNVKTNDRINGEPAGWKGVLSEVTSDHPDIKINGRTGDVTVKKGIKPGTYHAYYSLNERGNKDGKEQATVTVVVRSFDQIPGRNAASTGKIQVRNTVVYFHNDEPTKFQLFRPAFNYLNNFQNYLKQIPVFHKRSSESEVSLDTFFNNHVVAGFEDLNAGLVEVQKRLNQGVQVEISLTAYCSPIASSEYNEKLATRRLVAMIRYMKKWNKGALADAIASNRVTFWEHAVGELQAPRDVSSDYNKLDESVFGIKASRERRVSVTLKIIGSK